MEVTLNGDQEFFRDTTRKFLSAQCPLTKVRALESSGAGFDASYWRQGADLGWCSLLVPEQQGGGTISGRGLVDLTIIADAFGRHVAPGPLLPTNVVAATVARSGSDAQRAEFLGPIIGGEVTAAWCTEVTATADADGFVLSGVSAPVEAGAEAGILLVTAQHESGPTQFLVAPDAPGVTVTPMHSLDLVRRFARVQFTEARVAPSAVVGAPGDAEADVERQLQLALVMQTAEMVGAAETAFDFTVEWSFDRYSFGRPLASYQELKHRFADMKMWLEASHGLASALAREVEDGVPSAAETASVAKAYIGEYLAELMQDCVQIHGGIGLTRDHDLHLYLRRVTVDRATYGLPADHRQRVVALQVA